MSLRRISVLATLLVVGVAGIALYFIARPRPDRGIDKDQADHTSQVELAPYQLPQTIIVHAVYLGADARVLADTVAGPIEEQVNGVENMLSMSSQSSSDGHYRLQITFPAGADLNMAQTLVQNRVSMAMPVLPAIVQQEGILVRKRSAEPLMLIALTSPAGRFDEIYLANYAAIQVKDELARVSGVGDVSLIGRREYRVRVSLDPDKLAARELTAADVAKGLDSQNIRVAGLPLGQLPLVQSQAFTLTVAAVGRWIDPEQLEAIVLKATPEGQIVRLRDVARVELGRDEHAGSNAALNASPAVVACVYSLPNARPSQTSRAVADKIAELAERLPDGLALKTIFDFSANLDDPNNPETPGHLVIDAELPEAASAERMAEALKRAVEVVRQVPEARDVLALGEQPFSSSRNHPCLVVRLAPQSKRDVIADTIRGRLLTQLPEAKFRISVPSLSGGFPVYGFPVDFTIEDLGQHGSEALREKTAAMVEAMNQGGKFTDVVPGSGQRREPFLRLEIDRVKCAALNVPIKEILNTLQIFLGLREGSGFNQSGRSWHIDIRQTLKIREQIPQIRQLQVKNDQGQMIRLGTVMDAREFTDTALIERHNLYPGERITASLSAGVSPAEGKRLCEEMAGKQLDPKEFRLVWRTR